MPTNHFQVQYKKALRGKRVKDKSLLDDVFKDYGYFIHHSKMLLRDTSKTLNGRYALSPMGRCYLNYVTVKIHTRPVKTTTRRPNMKLMDRRAFVYRLKYIVMNLETQKERILFRISAYSFWGFGTNVHDEHFNCFFLRVQRGLSTTVHTATYFWQPLTQDAMSCYCMGPFKLAGGYA